MKKFSIAVVTCSTRSPRLNPFITEYVCNLLDPGYPDITVSPLDLADQSLPLYDEPAIPSQLPLDDPTPHYAHEHTRKWSAVVRQYDAFIFVTPQYNWSIPASLKNALDYLYHEWSGKPAAVVSYGGRGGSKAAAHLREILTGLRMKVAASAPQLVINVKTLDQCFGSGHLLVEDLNRWKEAGVEDELQSMLVQIIQMLYGQGTGASEMK